MQIIKSTAVLKELIAEQRRQGKTVGFVPTMGSLHEGHMSLARKSLEENDFTVLSIFVNPTQFGVNEDYNEYPRDIKKDANFAAEVGVDALFAPSVTEMYPKGYKTYVYVNDISKLLCGAGRPNHFRGVSTIIIKMLNIINPDKVYFGQKDAQQVIVIKKMVRDLNINVNIVTCPIIREEDGLAISSRNIYLNKNQRKAAVILSQALMEAKRLVENGENNKEKIIDFLTDKIASEKLAKAEYIEIVEAENLSQIDLISGNVLIALAVWFGNTRLIDNIIVEGAQCI